ncbi:glycosyltransferase family 2 protein [Empedobacter falsenii]|uniref:glycosyltransferase family 2 protein n=1 Tax=Empedobacter falsenii TaxID=343874 RepID=UPI0025776A11|nr:glycosyltransferase family 2 protein [Empedobacter falsenii]MDM1547824.1 glycosyltransferase family 2 protein [Empedobacter falsenii]
MSKVSILVPIYGVEQFIERCAISLFEQTFQDIEYIFVNDCTPDNSINILKQTLESYPHRKSQVQIINHEINKGLAGARNTGVESASGDYILHVDSDDYIEKDMVALLYEKAINENADIVMCNYFLEWEHVNKLVIQRFNENKVKFINSILSTLASPCVWNKLYRRSLYLDNFIKTFEGVNLGEDFITTPRLVYFSNKIVKVNKPLYHYIQTNANSYTSNLNKKNIDNVIFVLNYLTTFFQEKDDFELYEKAILQGKINKKIELIFNSKSDYWDELFGIFPETKSVKDLSFLDFRSKLIYSFINSKSKRSLIIFKKIYGLLFNNLQKLKGRN